MSIKNFDLHLNTKVHFGTNQISNLQGILKQQNVKKLLLVYGSSSLKKSGNYDKIIKQVKDSKTIELFEFNGIRSHPEVTMVRKGIEVAQKNSIDFILAVGGGSVIDACKAIAIGFYYCTIDPETKTKVKRDIWDVFNNFDNMMAMPVIIEKAIPIGVILTNAATGSEMNCAVVISNDEKGEKFFASYNVLRPRFAICDPNLTFSVPEIQTKSGCFDIISHLFEQYFSKNHPFLVDRLIEGCITTMFKYTAIVLQKSNDYEARSNIMWCSSLAMNDLMSSGRGFSEDWACHYIEHQISALFPKLPHGIGLAILTPIWMKHALKLKPDKFCTLGENVFKIEKGKTDIETAENVVAKIVDFLKKNKFPTKLTEVIPKFDTKSIEKVVSGINNRYGFPIGYYVNLKKEDVIKILKECI